MEKIVLGYLFTVLNYFLYSVSRFFKEKYQMRACDLLTKTAFVLGLLFMGSLSGAFSMMITLET